MAPPNLSLSIEGRLRDHLGVVSFRGVEEVNHLYRIDVDSLLDGGAVVRSFHGMAGQVGALGVQLHDRRAYRLALVPKMALLKGRRTRRVWVSVSSLGVAAELFKDHGILLRRGVQRARPLAHLGGREEGARRQGLRRSGEAPRARL